jgi:diadenosine tetraphosphate (Ap4A) HIT family hydrolase
MHVHFHIIPKPSQQAGLGIGWPAGEVDHERAKQLAERVRATVSA